MRSSMSLKQFHILNFILPIIMLASGTNLITPTQDEKVAVGPNQFDLLTDTSGWVLLDQRLFWTSDGGQAWEEITPSIPYGARIQDVEFIDANMGWIVWTTVLPDGNLSFHLASTTDRGTTWTIQPLSLFETNELASVAEKAGMDWFNAQTGWIAIQQSTSSNFSNGVLFKTSDAGSTWSRVSLPVADHIHFSDEETGWAVGGPTTGQIFRTYDAGASWQSIRPENTPNDALVTTYMPFYSNGQGILVTTSLGQENHVNTYVVENSSDDWLLLGQVPLDSQPGLIALSILDVQNFVATIPGTNSIVRMAGGVLNVIESLDGVSSSIVDLDMVSLDVGWATSVEASCVTASLQSGAASTSCSSTSQFVGTTDGGLTWQRVNLPPISPDTASVETFNENRAMEATLLTNWKNTLTLTGQGFDKCEIPTLSQMQTWSENSPYQAVNLYIGGSSRTCENAALDSFYLKQLYQQGWSFIPTWVGPQAPCTGYVSRMSYDLPTAYSQGVSEANLAVERLAELGLTDPDKTGSVVYYDIENYGTMAACRDAVESFMNGWVSQIRARGNLAGVYGSTLCNTGLSDFLTITNVPDVIWPARWYHNLGEGYYDPTATVWNLGTCLPNTVWANHQRIRQYEGDHDETWGNLTLGIDSNVLEGVVAIPSLDPAKISFQEVVSGLSNPVFITHAEDNSGRIFIVERSGRIRILKNGSLLATPFLNIQSIVKSTFGEQGLLALAFHPSYESNGKFYVAYTATRPNDSSGSILTLRQYSVSGNPDVADPNSGVPVLTIDHPAENNHNGGTLAFGNDGYLYWSTGDGGGGGDPDHNGQDLTSLLGKILRLDVNSGSPYSVPVSNPFYNDSNPNTKLIWAYGLRNPWRMAFDRLTHDLYIGDVGQGAREEIDFQPFNSNGGENYGWNIMEGSICYNAATCDQSNKVLPVAEYTHSLGCSVTGGYVYRGSNFPSLSGHYFYGDYCSGRLFSTYNDLPSGWSTPVQLADTSFNISTFGEDEGGELYLADYSTGKIYNIRYMEPTFSLSGNAGAAGVTLSYEVDGTTRTATSLADGSYSFAVPYIWSGMVTPSHLCYLFSPTNIPYTDVTTNQINQNYTATFDAASGCANIDVTIGGDLVESYPVPNGQSIMKYYPVDGGPVVIRSLNDVPIIASLNQWRKRVGATYWTGVAQTMALPTDQVSNKYVLPRYDYSIPSQQYNAILIANLDGVARDITVTIGGTAIADTFSLGASSSVYKTYNVTGGPVVVSSDPGAQIIASLYELRRDPTLAGWNDQNEMMGLPWEQVSYHYLLPIYFGAANPSTLDARLFIANVDTVSRDITVEIGGNLMGTYTLAPNTSQVKYYAVDGGPVEISSASGAKIIASLNQWRKRVGTTYWTGVAQSMALPTEQVSNQYVIPRYDNSNSAQQYNAILIANLDGVARSISLSIGGTAITDTFSVGAGSSVYKTYAVAGGPVVVSSAVGAQIIASLYELRRDPTLAGWSGQNEMMGLPWEQLTEEYLIPIYFGAANPSTLDARLFLAVP